LIKNDRYWRSLATEQSDVGNIFFHHGNSLRRTICIERVRGLPIVIRRDSNFGSARLPLFPDSVKHIAGMTQFDSRRAFILHWTSGLHRFAVFPREGSFEKKTCVLTLPRRSRNSRVTGDLGSMTSAFTRIACASFNFPSRTKSCASFRLFTLG